MNVPDSWRKASASAVEHLRAAWSCGRHQKPRDFVTEWTITILFYLFATTTLVQAYVVPTGSMEGNLRVGDHLFADRMAYADPGVLGRHLLPSRDPQRGDIVVFSYPDDVRQTYVKRVIGVPGDRIRFVDKTVIRNGRRLIEPYVTHITDWIDSYRDNFPQPPCSLTTPGGREMLAAHVREGEVIVPPGKLFVLGDNRDNSIDSRYWGFVPREYVLGRPVLVYWSYDAPTEELQEWSLAHLADVAMNFFSKTRWERTFLIPRSRAAEETGGTE